MSTEPLGAYEAAHAALGASRIADDEVIRAETARQIVAVLTRMRSERGLAWIRKVPELPRFIEICRVANEIGPRNTDMLVGARDLHDAYEAAAAVFVEAYARKR